MTEFNATTPLSIGDLIFFENMDHPAILIANGLQGDHRNRTFALRLLDPDCLEDCAPPLNLFRKYHPNNHPNICVQTIEQNAELGAIVRIVRFPRWETITG